MQNLLRTSGSSARRIRNRPGFTALAVLMLSLGVGATTALFSLVDGVMPRTATSVRCETVMRISGDAPGFRVASMPDGAELRERVSDAYETSMESASDAFGALPSVMPEANDASGAIDALGERPILALLGAFALGFLVLCTRAASRLAMTPRAPLAVAATAIGALGVAVFALRTLGLPPLGARAIAFALCISLVTVFFARSARKRGAPLTI